MAKMDSYKFIKNGEKLEVRFFYTDMDFNYQDSKYHPEDCCYEAFGMIPGGWEADGRVTEHFGKITKALSRSEKQERINWYVGNMVSEGWSIDGMKEIVGIWLGNAHYPTEEIGKAYYLFNEQAVVIDGLTITDMPAEMLFNTEEWKSNLTKAWNGYLYGHEIFPKATFSYNNLQSDITEYQSKVLMFLMFATMFGGSTYNKAD